MEAKNHKLVVLFTSVGRRVELVKIFRQALDSLKIEGRLIGVDIDPLAPALHFTDGRYLVPRYHSSGYLPALLKICREEKVDVILPLIDPDISVLAAHREELEKAGARPAVVSQSASEISSDKWLTTSFFRDLGLKTARSWLVADLRDKTMEYPAFIKPRKGSAAKSTFKINNPEEWAFFSSYVPEAIVQEYIDGEEITNDVICDLQGRVLSVVSRKRIEVRWGEVAKGVTVFNPAITDACVKIAEALPATGPITVQCIIRDGIPYFTEINARLGGGAPLGVAAGADWPRLLLARWAGIPAEIPPLGNYQIGLHMTRYDQSYFIDGADLEQLASVRL